MGTADLDLKNNIMSFIIPLMLVCITVSSVQSVTKKKTGDSIVLQPGNKPEKLNSVVWKHGEHRAAEWYEGDDDVSYYRIFNGSSVLDKLTCSLTINNLDKDFIGTYTAEINGLNPTKSETLEVFDPVSDVTISPDRECTDVKSDNCTLTCEGKGDGPFTYSWTPGGSSASQVMVQKGKEVTEYTCVVRNPVSSKEEKYTVQAKGSSDNGAAIGVPIAVVLVLAIAIAIGVYLWYKKKCGLALFNRGEGTNEGEGGAGGAGGAGGVGDAPVVVNMENKNEHVGNKNEHVGNNPDDNNMPNTAEEDVKGKNTQNGEPIATMEEAREGDNTPEPEQTLHTAHNAEAVADANSKTGASKDDNNPEPEPELEPEPTPNADLDASNRTGPVQSANTVQSGGDKTTDTEATDDTAAGDSDPGIDTDADANINGTGDREDGEDNVEKPLLEKPRA